MKNNDMEILPRDLKFHWDDEEQQSILLQGMTSLKKKLKMLYMFALVHKIFKNVIYRIDVRAFIEAGVPC